MTLKARNKSMVAEPSNDIHPVALEIACEHGLDCCNPGYYQDLTLDLIRLAIGQLGSLIQVIYVDDAVTVESVTKIKNVMSMVGDALYLSALSATEATPPTNIRRGD